MARTEHTTGHTTGHTRRRFVTRHDVEDAAAAGRALQVAARDVLTDEAAQRARELGVAVQREGDRSTTTAADTTDDLRRAVRAAVVAELGQEPPGLDEAIERVLARRR
jgi:hypothetical protein